jgi:endonuclease G
MKLPVELITRAEEQFSRPPEAIKELRERIAKEDPLKLDGRAQFERRKEMIAAVATEDVLDAQERYLGTNDLLPINYLLLGYLQSRAVGRLRYFDKTEGKVASATGFLISDSLMMTNHHVFPVDDLAGFRNFAEDATIEFNYEFSLEGAKTEAIVYDLVPDQFLFTDKALDMAVVAVKPVDRTGEHKLKEQGYLVLNQMLGKAGLGDWATIIQHPEGHPKQIALRNNSIIDMSAAEALIYVSDTAPGSSGAPVFNNEWQVIALHSAGVAKKNADGKYVDKDDQVIEPVNGRIDGNRVVWVSNRGIRVSAIMNGLSQAPEPVATHPFVRALFSPAYTDSRPYAFLSRPSFDTHVVAVETNGNGNGTSTAAVTATPVQPITVNISIGGGVPAVTHTIGAPSVIVSEADLEKKFEDEMDYSACTGFDEDFMSVRIPMPTPTTALRKKLAFHLESPNSYLLKYHHFTTMHHAVRRVPVVSAINIHGKFRYVELGKGTRVDKWFRDNRIDFDVQLNDEFYATSGFDKGHMARREDAEWGTTMAKAKRAADMTCSYANAAPQVPALNRNIFGYHGLWGQLEGKLLEQGVEDENGQSARISVFNGPIFKSDDPVFKGVQVAMDFFKVVVWRGAGNKLRTTCFTLTQEELVGDIAFEVLRFDEIFKTHQVPIAEIESLTGLRFHANIKDVDTSAGDDTILDERSFERQLDDLKEKEGHVAAAAR